MPRTPIDITIPAQHGRTVLVTGASDGMGLRIAGRLAAVGAELILPVRNRTKGEAARERILQQTPEAQISLRDLDLSSLASVATLGDELRGEGRPIHLLINNAGVMQPPSRRTTVDGFELQMGTNHLGHAALVAALMPLLRAGAARITSQVSVAASRGRVDLEDMGQERSYDAMRAYRASKIALGLFGLELERRSRAQGWGITSNLSHPGVAPTSLLAARPEMGRRGDTLSVRAIRALSARGVLVGTVESAGLPALMAATDPTAEPGALYGPSGPWHLGGRPARQPLYRPLRDPEAARRVWAMTEELTGVPIAA